MAHLASSVDSIDPDLEDGQKKKLLPPKKKLTELEKHDGWIENLRNEERTMKE